MSKPSKSNLTEAKYSGVSVSRSRLLVLAIVAFAMLALAGTTVAQDPTPTSRAARDSGSETPDGAPPTLDPGDATATEDSSAVTGTQAVLDLTATADYATQVAVNAAATSEFATAAAIEATATGQFYATQTATARPSPTVTFQPMSVVLLVSPLSPEGHYSPADVLKFSVRVWNTGNLREDRPINVVMVYDAKTFSPPTEGSVSDGGQVSESTITWRIEDGIFPGEDSAREFSFMTRVLSDLTANTEGTVQAVISTRAGAVLAQSEPLRIPVVVVEATVTPAGLPAGSTIQVPQGEGLFQDAGSFAVLIGVFFSIGLIGIFTLGGLGIYWARNDESKEHVFTGTTEIFLLLLVLFSVIIMGVQNAIDRQSINAIIGGIVGYVAGRASSRISLPLDRFRSRERSAAETVTTPAAEEPESRAENDAAERESGTL